jgi:hypothetical protein
VTYRVKLVVVTVSFESRIQRENGPDALCFVYRPMKTGYAVEASVSFLSLGLSLY